MGNTEQGYGGAFDLVAIERYIEQHCHETTLADVGAHFNCHPNSVTRALRKGRGLSFEAALRQAKARRACRLLEQGATVEQAAAGCGYHNLGHFYAMFQKTCGTTPGAYRREAIGSREQHARVDISCLQSVA